VTCGLDRRHQYTAAVEVRCGGAEGHSRWREGPPANRTLSPRQRAAAMRRAAIGSTSPQSRDNSPTPDRPDALPGKRNRPLSATRAAQRAVS
jgi:hypothetical protein